jgi:hypothetical protein
MADDTSERAGRASIKKGKREDESAAPAVTFSFYLFSIAFFSTT